MVTTAGVLVTRTRDGVTGITTADINRGGYVGVQYVGEPYPVRELPEDIKAV
jgi:hypothetical protein